MKTISGVVFATVMMTGLAFAQSPDPKAKAGAPVMKKEAPPPMAPPKVPQEVVAMAKTSGGTWKCKGTSYEMDGSTSAVTAVNKSKADLDKWWIVETLDVKSKMPFKMTSYTTYDATAKKWRRISMDSWGGSMTGTAAPADADGKMMFQLDSSGPMGPGLFRDYLDPSDKKAGLKVWGEMSMDKGKSWHKVYEMTCKK